MISISFNIILHSRKTLLFHNKQPWVKKFGTEDFDVPMGCFDGAEISELVGSFIIYQLNKIGLDKKLIGLYRDDGLGVLRNTSGPETNRIRKLIIQLFKDHGLSITINTNIHIVNFLDVQFDIKNDLYRPYMKPNNTSIYINKL